MTFRPRVCAAIIRNNKILMVFHDHGDRSFWTLPGGAVEEGETFEEAVVREVNEEVKLNCNVIRLLFEDSYEYGPNHCYLVEVNNEEEAELGEDPELQEDKQVLKGIGWFAFEEKKNDIQICKVIKNLYKEEVILYSYEDRRV
ncbi:NUDIX domain-containing protein [Paenibacillus sp. GCM10028914]|uniref:NUDIX domain-containing protein n=1 Tax=Paenibacillus sp. GCM10028914 TaxID=3273416 RepID=UPI003620406F